MQRLLRGKYKNSQNTRTAPGRQPIRLSARQPGAAPAGRESLARNSAIFEVRCAQGILAAADALFSHSASRRAGRCASTSCASRVVSVSSGSTDDDSRDAPRAYPVFFLKTLCRKTLQTPAGSGRMGHLAENLIAIPPTLPSEFQRWHTSRCHEERPTLRVHAAPGGGSDRSHHVARTGHGVPHGP